MALDVKQFTFTKRSGTGSQEVNVTSFTPKALILWSAGVTNESYNEHYNISFGFSDGTNDRCISFCSQDNAAATVMGAVKANDSIIDILSTTTPTTEADVADVTSFDADGFTLNWSVSSTNLWPIHGIAIGGSDITNVLVTTKTTGTTATGNQAYTGIGFQGDWMLTLRHDNDVTENTTTTNVPFSIGSAISSTARWATSITSENGRATMDNWRWQKTDRVLVSMLGSSGGAHAEADFVSWGSDGFTLNWTDGPSGTTEPIYYLIIKGGKWQVGNFTQRSGTGTQDVSFADSTIDPAQAFMCSVNNTVISTIAAHNRLSIGGSDGTNEGCVFVGDTDGVGNNVTARVSLTTKAIRLATEAATATSSTTNSEADMNDMATAGKFQLNWTTADATAREILYWIVGTVPTGAQFNRSPTAENITVSDASTTRILTANRVPSTDSTTVSDASLTRATQAFRVPSSDSVTVTDASLTQSKTWSRVPSTDSTTVSDASTTRMLSATRAPTPENPALSENVTRTTQAFRVPSSDSTTVSDASTTRSLTAVRLPSTDTVTPTDVSTTQIITRVRAPSADTVTPSDSSLTRMLSATRVPSSDSVTVDENVSGGKLLERVPSTDSVTVADSSLTRLLSASRLPSTDSITTGENLTRILSAIRSPSSDSIVVTDVSTTQSLTRGRSVEESVIITDASLTRLLQATRVPGTDTITVVDSSLTRIYSALRIPTADDVLLSENVTGVKTVAGIDYVRSPSAENITVTDASLTRMLSALRVPGTETTTVTDSSLTRIYSALRIPSSDSIVTSDNATSLVITPGQFNRFPATENVTIEENLTRLLQLFRVPSADTTTITENSLTRSVTRPRVPSTDTVVVSAGTVTGIKSAVRIVSEDTINVSEASLTRLLSAIRTVSPDTTTVTESSLTGSKIMSRVTATDNVTVTDASLTRIRSLLRTPTEDTTSVIESSLVRLLSAIRSPSTDTVTVSELQGLISHSRLLQETISITEPSLTRIVTAIRSLGPEFVDVSEQVFFQTWHRFVFDSVEIAEQLFSERQALSGSVTYATPEEVRPLLGNIGGQRTDPQIQVAIDSAYDEINRRTNRQPPNDWKNTENDFGIIKKICRFKAALEMAVGIKDFEDREWMQKEIEEMFTIIEEHDPGGATSNDIVGSSGDETFALNPGGIIWSTRYPNLKRSSSGENDTTINPDT